MPMPRKPTQKGSLKSLSQTINDFQRNKIIGQKVVDLRQYREAITNQRTPSILVVDADDTFRNAIKRSLETDGYEVLVAADAMELSAIMGRCTLDLIILDIEIPWVNGFELCEILKAHPAVKDIPVVLVGQKNQIYDPQVIGKSGCDNFLLKPLKSEALSTILDQLIGE